MLKLLFILEFKNFRLFDKGFEVHVKMIELFFIDDEFIHQITGGWCEVKKLRCLSLKPE